MKVVLHNQGVRDCARIIRDPNLLTEGWRLVRLVVGHVTSPGTASNGLACSDKILLDGSFHSLIIVYSAYSRLIARARIVADS